MYGLPLNQSITSFLNTTQIPDFNILTFAYHPVYAQLLFIIYGYIFNSTSFSYQHHFLKIWNTNRQAIIIQKTYNQTLGGFLNCSLSLTNSIMMVESETGIFVYKMTLMIEEINQQDDLLLELKKQLLKPSGYNFFKLGGMMQNIFVLIDVIPQIIIIGNIDPSSNNITFYYYNVTNIGQIFHVQIASDAFYLAISNGSRTSMYIYPCFECLYSGIIPNGSLLDLSIAKSFQLQTNYFFYMDMAFSRSYSTNNIQIYWINIDFKLYKYIKINETFMLSPELFNQTTSYMIKNKDFIYMYKKFQLLMVVKHYEIDLSDQQRFQQQKLLQIHNRQINKVATQLEYQYIAINFINPNDHIANLNLIQYLLVDSCQDYETITLNFTCKCIIYDGYMCKKKSQNKKELPTYILVVLVIGVIALIAASIVMVKYFKRIKRCLKGNKRIPWKYSPIQIAFHY